MSQCKIPFSSVLELMLWHCICLLAWFELSLAVAAASPPLQHIKLPKSFLQVLLKNTWKNTSTVLEIYLHCLHALLPEPFLEVRNGASATSCFLLSSLWLQGSQLLFPLRFKSDSFFKKNFPAKCLEYFCSVWLESFVSLQASFYCSPTALQMKEGFLNWGNSCPNLKTSKNRSLPFALK